jgi:hypothetical protein
VPPAPTPVGDSATISGYLGKSDNDLAWKIRNRLRRPTSQARYAALVKAVRASGSKC